MGRQSEHELSHHHHTHRKSSIVPRIATPSGAGSKIGGGVKSNGGASCSEALIEDDDDKAFTAAAIAAALQPMANPDTRSVDGYKRVPTLRARRANLPPRLTNKPNPPPLRHLPIWYALPSLDAFRRVRTDVGDACLPAHKPFDFAPMRPGRIATYKYETQSAYYTQYAQSLYAITGGKAGLDCMRHYEILGSGAVPFFVDSAALDQSPLSMYAFPRELVQRAARLPGVPSEAAVSHALKTDGALSINHSAFDRRAYCEIRAQLLAHTEMYLTTTNLASYVLEQMRQARPSAFGIDPRSSLGASSSQRVKYSFGGGGSSAQQPRVLIVSSKGVSGDTWQNAFLYHGLVSILGHRVSSWLGRKEVLYHDFVYPHRFCCYGRGYSYARTLPTPLVYKRCKSKEVADALLRDQLRRRLDSGYFNLILVTTQSNKCCGVARCYGDDVKTLLNAYLRRNGNRTALATIDGSDGYGGCNGQTFAGELERIDAHFLREVDVKHAGRTARLVQKPVTRVLGALSSS